MQALGEVGLAGPLALAGARRFRPAEDRQEVRVEAVVRQLHGPRAGGHGPNEVVCVPVTWSIASSSTSAFSRLG